MSFCWILDERNISAQGSHGAFASQAATCRCRHQLIRLLCLEQVLVFRTSMSKSADKRGSCRRAGSCHMAHGCCFLHVPSLVACQSRILKALPGLHWCLDFQNGQRCACTCRGSYSQCVYNRCVLDAHSRQGRSHVASEYAQ